MGMSAAVAAACLRRDRAGSIYSGHTMRRRLEATARRPRASASTARPVDYKTDICSIVHVKYGESVD